MFRSHSRFTAYFTVPVLLSALAACGGGGNTATPIPPAAPNPTATPCSSSGACSAISSAVVLQPSPTTTPLPPTGGITGTINLPAGAGSLQMATSTQNPTTSAPPSSNVALLYVTLTAVNGSVSLNGLPGFSLVLPTTPLAAVHLGQLNDGAWTIVEGPATVNGMTVVLNGTSQAISLKSGQSIYLMVEQNLTPILAPTSSPTTSANPGAVPGPGSFVEYPVPAFGSPAGITVGADGALWFVTGNTYEQQPLLADVGRISTLGQFNLYPAPLNTSEPTSVPPILEDATSGPDGAIWFTATIVAGPTTTALNGVVGRTTLAGQIEEFTVPGNSTVGISIPYGIAAGPDSALWFADSGQRSIDRITTAGAITKYLLPEVQTVGPNDGDSPSSIVAGSDGALWVTVDGAGQSIARVTTSGSFTEYPVSSSDGSLPGARAIVAGPDGALWFILENPNQIARITTGGQMTFFPIPFYNGLPVVPWAICVGPDGALWFGGQGAFGRITTQGAITEFPSPGIITSITTGSDKNLWFTDGYDNEIGTLVP